MRHIYKVYYENQITRAMEIYKKRFEFDTTVHLPFSIQPYRSMEQLKLYYVPTAKIEMLLSEIYKLDKNIEERVASLPPIAHLNFIVDMQLEELQNTNEIEGVRSTKKELSQIKKKMAENRKEQLRFQSLIQSYDKLLQGELPEIENARDIRNIYDALVLDEIAPDDLPDGDIFTIEASQISRKSGTGKVIHEGLFGEKRKIDYVNAMIDFMKDGQLACPPLIKVCVFHFLFGYVHPFYDGNGRTSRFIASLYINRELSKWTSISLSRGCKKNENMYLDAFENANRTINFGEMNVFIEHFLEIIKRSQEITLMNLSEKIQLLDSFIAHLEKNFSNEEREFERKILFVIAQHFYFSIDETGLTRKDIHGVFRDETQSHIVPALTYLVENNLIEQSGKSPIYYQLSEAIFRE